MTCNLCKVTLMPSHNGAQEPNFYNKLKFTCICFELNLPVLICQIINNKSISKVEKTKDLGIILASNLSLDHHYKKSSVRYINFLIYFVGPSQLTQYYS